MVLWKLIHTIQRKKKNEEKSFPGVQHKAIPPDISKAYSVSYRLDFTKKASKVTSSLEQLFTNSFENKTKHQTKNQPPKKQSAAPHSSEGSASKVQSPFTLSQSLCGPHSLLRNLQELPLQVVKLPTFQNTYWKFLKVSVIILSLCS